MSRERYNDDDEDFDTEYEGGDEAGGIIDPDESGGYDDGDEDGGDDDEDGGYDDGDEDGGYDDDDEDGGLDDDDELGGRRKRRSRGKRKGKGRKAKGRKRRGRCGPRGPRPILFTQGGCATSESGYGNAGLGTNARPTAPTGKAGVRFAAGENLRLISPPIPVDRRASRAAVLSALVGSALVQPSTTPLASTTSFGTVYLSIDPSFAGTLFGAAAVAPASTNMGLELSVPFAGVKVEIGLPGVSASAGSALTINVFTQFKNNATIAANPFTVADAAEGGTRVGAFHSGSFVVAPKSNACVCAMFLMTYEVVNGQPNPKMSEISVFYVYTGAVGVAVRTLAVTATSLPGASSAPQSTLTLTAITTNTPEFNALLAVLSGKKRPCR